MDDVTPLRELAGQSHAWPFEEARKIVARLKRKPGDEVIFETGYGPSGLPHIGTFGEVARTSMASLSEAKAPERTDSRRPASKCAGKSTASRSVLLINVSSWPSYSLSRE